MGQVSNYDSVGRASRDVLAQDLASVDQSLLEVYRAASHPAILGNPRDPADPANQTYPGIPDLLVQYVENGRNPDIYTREFVELVRRMNQLARGKMGAFRSFRDVLAHEMESALPEVKEDVARVIEATGGPTPQAPTTAMAGLAVGGGGGGASGGEGTSVQQQQQQAQQTTQPPR